jgi:uncharacterized membrane protein
VAKTAARAKFQGPEPIATRPEDRIAAETAARRAARAADRTRRSGLTRPSPMMAAILFFATAGFLIAAYTTAVHYIGPSLLACTAAKAGHESSCEQVQFSQWNNVAGIPVSVLGLIGYFGIFVSLRVRNDLGRVGGFGIALVGFLFSLYLTYREAFTLHEYCEWCLGSAACMTVLTILLGIRFIGAAPVSPATPPAPAAPAG